MTNKYYISIDPGATGAIAIINTQEKGYSLHTVHDIPWFTDTQNKKQIDALKLIDVLLQYKILHAYIEKVHSSPQMGVASSFNFGRSKGIIEGVLAGMEVPVSWVTPQYWKKRFKLTGTEKDAAREKVIHMLPQHKELFKRKKDIDRADAVLIGLSRLRGNT